MTWDQIEGPAKELHYGALRLLRKRLGLRGTSPSVNADKGRFEEELGEVTGHELPTTDGKRDKLAGLLRQK